MIKASWKKGEPLAPYSTLRIGGPADYFFVARTEKELVGAVGEARRLKLPVTLLGWGSNVLISDRGIRGLVIKNETAEIKIGGAVSSEKTESVDSPRWQADKKKGTFKYEFADLDYDESGAPRIKVIISSGYSLPKAINDLLDQGITGLQWFARIPGTVGGAVHNNIHGGTHFFSEFVGRVKVLNADGEMIWLSVNQLKLAYDQSRFHDGREIILAVELNLYRGDAERAKAAAFEWAKRKSLQPPRSAGCTFKNISNEDKERLGLLTTSVGYIIEHILEMGGYRVGGAAVSAAHHNFIVNTGRASAKDYLAVLHEIQKRTKEKLGIELEPEIILLGEF